MITLYHHPMLPGCRRIRLILAEHRLEFELKTHSFWERDEAILRLNPAGKLPILMDNDEIIVGARPIGEYLEDMYANEQANQAGEAFSSPAYLRGRGAVERAEVRRLIDWFDDKFLPEVNDYMVGEKIYRRLARQGEPDPKLIKIGGQNLAYHLDYMNYLLSNREWLAGNRMTITDFAAASALSLLDYLGEVPWKQHPTIKAWYINLKHRPSFRPLLNDRLAGLPPYRDYTNLDF